MIINITTIPQGVILSQGRGHAAGSRNQPSPCIILVLHHCCARTVDDGHHIALQIGDVVVRHIIVANHQGSAIRAVAETHHYTAPGHLGQLGTVVQVTISDGAIGPACPHTVDIVGKVPGGTALRHGSKLPTIFPGIGPSTDRHRIADLVISNRRIAILGQQVAPVIVAIGIDDSRIATNFTQRIGEFRFAQNVACAIVFPYPGFVRRLVIPPDQLVDTVPGGVVPLRDLIIRWLHVKKAKWCGMSRQIAFERTKAMLVGITEKCCTAILNVWTTSELLHHIQFLSQKSNHQSHHPSDGHYNENDRDFLKTILPKMHCHINLTL